MLIGCSKARLAYIAAPEKRQGGPGFGRGLVADRSGASTTISTMTTTITTTAAAATTTTTTTKTRAATDAAAAAALLSGICLKPSESE